MKPVNCIVLGILSASIALSVWAADSLIDIVVSPKVLVLHSKTPGPVTVHADIPFTTVASGTVCLQINGEVSVYATSIFPDDRGDLVAKFDSGTVKAAVEAPQAEFVLVGELKDGKTFEGFNVVPVR